MIAGRVRIWKKAPFLRLLVPLIIGIILQWQLQLPATLSWSVFSISLAALFTGFLLPQFTRFRFTALSGVAVAFIFLSFGSLLICYKDVRRDPKWFGNYYNGNNLISVRLTEPLVEKTNSYKAIATVTSVGAEGKKFPTSGEVIIYF